MFQENFHVSITSSCSNHHDMTNPIIEIPKVGVQLLEWQIMLHLYIQQCTACIQQYMYRCGEMAANIALSWTLE